MELGSFSALDEQITREDWKQTPASVRRLLRWLFESYEQRLADLEEEKALSSVENQVTIEKRSISTSDNFTKRQELGCSFCGKSQKVVAKLIAGPGVYICNECIEVCNLILEDGAQ